MSHIVELFGESFHVVIKRNHKNRPMVVLEDFEVGEPSVISTPSEELGVNEVAIKDLDYEKLTEKLIDTGLFTCADKTISQGFQGYRVLNMC